MTTTNGTKLAEIRARLAELKKAQEGNKQNGNVNQEKLNNATRTNFIPCSATQITTYVDLCGKKNQIIDANHTRWSISEMSKRIKELLKLPTIRFATEAQCKMVQDILDRNNWEADCDYTRLINDGRENGEGSIGRYISELVQLEQEMQSVSPLTDEQLETILEMKQCPEVNLADLHESYEIVYMHVDGQLRWMQTSDEDLVATAPELVTFRQASDFIRKYQVEFYQWKRTRLTPAQMKKIQYTQEKCGMKAMPEYALLQFDKETANQYLSNLELVWRDADLVKFSYEETYSDMSQDRPNHDMNDVAQKELSKKENIIHSLYASVGMLAKEDSENQIDTINYENLDETIVEVANMCMPVAGREGVLELLREVYSEAELCVLFPEEDEKKLVESAVEAQEIVQERITVNNGSAQYMELREMITTMKDMSDGAKLETAVLVTSMIEDYAKRNLINSKEKASLIRGLNFIVDTVDEGQEDEKIS